jgi:excisionase family DNA binding protein
MSTRLARSFHEDSSDDLREHLSKKDLTDCLEGRKHALVVTDIAELLSISERKVYILVAEQRIPCFKIGGSIRFDPFAISAWLRQKMSAASVEDLRERRDRT